MVERVLEFLENVRDGDDDARDGVPAKHADYRDWMELEVNTCLEQTGGGDVLYCSGFQNGSTAMAYRIPMMDTGIVDRIMPKNTEINWIRESRELDT